MVSEIKKAQLRFDKEFASFFLTANIKQHSTKVTYASFFQNRMLIVAAIREGLPYALFQLIKQMTPFSDADWAELLGISAKSLQRYKLARQSFKLLHSERIIELAEVTKLGLEVFGETDKFRQWLDTPNYALGKLKPFELLKDSYGKELLMTELTHINHGILA